MKTRNHTSYLLKEYSCTLWYQSQLSLVDKVEHLNKLKEWFIPLQFEWSSLWRWKPKYYQSILLSKQNRWKKIECKCISKCRIKIFPFSIIWVWVDVLLLRSYYTIEISFSNRWRIYSYKKGYSFLQRRRTSPYDLTCILQRYLMNNRWCNECLCSPKRLLEMTKEFNFH